MQKMLNLAIKEQAKFDICPNELQSKRCPKPYFSDYGAHGCGHCHICRRQKASEWTKRLTWEFLSQKEACFITLTYRGDHERSQNLCYRDIQLFLKRTRKYLSTYHQKKIKFFCAGEYGERNTMRAHWHLIFFGVSQETASYCVEQFWREGERNDTQQINEVEGVAKYVSQYVLKKAGERTKDYELQNGRKAPFNRQSQGLGLKFSLENFAAQAYFNYQLNGTFNDMEWNGKPLFLPKYIRNKLGEHFGILDQLKKNGIRNLKDYLDETIQIFKDYASKKGVFTAIAYAKPDYKDPRIQRNEKVLAWKYRHQPKYDAEVEKFRQYIFKRQLEAQL